MTNGMPRPRSDRKKAITLRLNAELVDDFRAFCRDYAGKPLYLSPASFVEAAITLHLATLRRRVEQSDTASICRERNATHRR